MKDVIAKILKKSLDEFKISVSEENILKAIEVPPTSEMGDYAFPCFFLALIMKKNPHQIALEIREKIKKIPAGFEDIQVSGPYLNFFLDRKNLSVNLIKEILEKKDDFGKSDVGKGEKVLIEHTSINPNASPHVGRARNALIGDSVTKILRFLNFDTEVHYYVNDISKQVAMLVLGNAEKLKFEGMLKRYASISKKVEKSKTTEKKVFDLLNKFESGDPEITKRFQQIVNTCVKGQEKILSNIGIKFDFFDYESFYLQSSKKVLEELEKTQKLFKDKDGRQVLDQKGTSVENRMKSPVLVLTRSDGTGLYPLRDISYTSEKIKKSKKNIIVLGEDQKLYFQQISEALKLLGLNSPEVIHYSFILISSKGKSKKMSTRKGDVVLLEDFIDDAIAKAKKEILKRKTKGDAKKVGISAVKYAILKKGPNKPILFDLNEALNFEGDTGPYILYSYARASNILKKSKKKIKEIISPNELEQKEIELIKNLSNFPGVVLDAYKNLNPSSIANYSYQLAQTFNEFYHVCPVIGSEEKENFRLALVEAFRIVLKNSLNLIGIETIEEM